MVVLASNVGDKKAPVIALNFQGRYFSDLLTIGEDGEFYALCAPPSVHRCLLLGIGEKWWQNNQKFTAILVGNRFLKSISWVDLGVFSLQEYRQDIHTKSRFQKLMILQNPKNLLYRFLYNRGKLKFKRILYNFFMINYIRNQRHMASTFDSYLNSLLPFFCITCKATRHNLVAF